MVKILNVFNSPFVKTNPQRIQFVFFGDSLVDRPSIVVDNPHYDLPTIGTSVEVKNHETSGFFKLVKQRIKSKHPEVNFDFKNCAIGGSNVRDVEGQINTYESMSESWDVSFVCVGLNDVMRKFQGRLSEAVPIDEFRHHYSNIVNRLKKRSM